MSRRSQREISVLVPPNLVPLTREDPRRVGPYLVIGRVGAGGSGTVYAAVNPMASDDPLVAVKTLHPARVADDSARGLLRQRLQALSSVDGRVYVPPITFDTDASPPWLAMRFVSGIPLPQHTRKRGGLGQGRLLALAAGLAEGVSALHGAQVAHGELKPSSVLLGVSGPRILDCALPGDEETLRRSAPTWLSPERHEGAPPSPQADVYAWGAVMAFASTGRLPFGLGEPEVVARRVLQDDPDIEGVPEDLLPVVRRSLSKDPAERPSVRELIGASISAWERNGGTVPPEFHGTAITRVLSREWQGMVEPARMPRVIHLESGRLKRPGRIPLVAGGAAVALALMAGGVWAGVTALSGEGDSTGAGPEAGSSPRPEATAEENTATVRFDPADQTNPAKGPWVYTRVEPKDGASPSAGAEDLTLEQWSERWTEVKGAEEETANITPETKVLCARFCVPGPGNIKDGRGTYPVRSQDFINNLNWGKVVIAEVKFADEKGGASPDEPRRILRITELFPQPPEE